MQCASDLTYLIQFSYAASLVHWMTATFMMMTDKNTWLDNIIHATRLMQTSRLPDLQ